MRWPLRFFTPIETASNTYEVLISVNDAMARLEGDALAKWKAKNERRVSMATAIERMMSDENDGD